MLDGPDPAASAAKLIGLLPCRVLLPDALCEQFESRGPAPSAPEERRRFSRLRCRSTDNRAAVQSQATYPQLARAGDWSTVYVTDISRNGLHILHFQQLFPGERLRVVLLTGTDVVMEVVRCRRLAETCFSVGLRVGGEQQGVEATAETCRA